MLLLVSALAAFTRPANGSLGHSGIATWGTFCGAVCFSFGGVLQAFERPREIGRIAGMPRLPCRGCGLALDDMRASTH